MLGPSLRMRKNLEYPPTLWGSCMVVTTDGENIVILEQKLEMTGASLM